MQAVLCSEGWQFVQGLAQNLQAAGKDAKIDPKEGGREPVRKAQTTAVL